MVSTYKTIISFGPISVFKVARIEPDLRIHTPSATVLTTLCSSAFSKFIAKKIKNRHNLFIHSAQILFFLMGLDLTLIFIYFPFASQLLKITCYFLFTQNVRLIFASFATCGAHLPFFLNLSLSISLALLYLCVVPLC